MAKGMLGNRLSSAVAGTNIVAAREEPAEVVEVVLIELPDSGPMGKDSLDISNGFYDKVFYSG